jgi:fermentation-respiration switch protein FrsA (DUF1100 family)
MLVSVLHTSAGAVEQAANGTPVSWLVAGPFPVSGDNALFHHYLSSSEGEERVRARAGTLAGKSSAKTIEWQAASPGRNGEIDFRKIWPTERRAIAFAYAELDSPLERFVAATVGSGNHIQLRLNGEVIYESRLSRKPEPDKDTIVLRLRKGLNTLLAKVEGGQDNWNLQLRTHLRAGRMFINQRATVIPDFRIGQKTEAWGQVEVANAGDAPLTDVTVEIAGDDLVLPSRSARVSLAPGEVQRIPFWVAERAATPAAGAKPLRLRLTAGVEVENIEFTPRFRKATEYFVTTYRSAVDGSVQPFSVLLPSAYDPTIAYPLILLLHGAHVTDWGQNIISYEPKEWAIQVAVHDRGNNRYRDIGEIDLDEVLVEVERRYRIDAERMYLSGHSMGGYGAWFQATRRPDRWASISPQAGYADYFLYHPAMRAGRGHALGEFQKRLLEHWSPLGFAENLLHVPAYIVHGAKDDNVDVKHSRKMAARLRELRYTHVYDENPEGGHWWGPRGADYGVEVVDKPPIWTFLRKHSRRALAPRRVVYLTDTLRYRRAYWVAIDELDTANQLARIEAELTAPNTISVALVNITQFTLRLDNGLVRMDEPVSVQINGRLAFRGRLPGSAQLTLRREPGKADVQLFNPADMSVTRPQAVGEIIEATAGELDVGGQVARFFARPPGPLKKSERLYGPVSDAFNTPFLFVIGTAGGERDAGALRRAAHRAAEALARDWMARANGIVRLKRDSEVTTHDIASNNLILFGNARINSLIAQINDDLPIRFTADGFTTGGQIKRGDDLGLVLAVPNPLNLQRYAVIVGGHTPQSFEAAARLRFAELPDYVIFDRSVFAGEEPAFVAAGFFDKFWRLAEPTPISRSAEQR